tara:strand:+ start:616 stop:792 length:177 start_codon:yes stop_codon:yes gene_type:complete
VSTAPLSIVFGDAHLEHVLAAADAELLVDLKLDGQLPSRETNGVLMRGEERRGEERGC